MTVSCWDTVLGLFDAPILFPPGLSRVAAQKNGGKRLSPFAATGVDYNRICSLPETLAWRNRY